MAEQEDGNVSGSQSVSAEASQGFVAAARPTESVEPEFDAGGPPNVRPSESTTAPESVCESPEIGHEPDARPVARQIQENDLRQLRRVYFTVRHDRVDQCGHKLDRMNQPTTNCEACWWCWLNSHGTLVQAVEEAFQKQGADFVIKLRGRKFLRMFLRFMATVAAMQKEAEKEVEMLKTIDFKTERTKPLAELTANDVPRGLDPEDVATDFETEKETKNE